MEVRRLLAATLPPGFAYSAFVTGLPECTSEVFAPDGRLFYTEKSGAVRIVNPDGTRPTTPLVTVAVDGYFERGLECIELDPGFATNGNFYLYYTRRDPANPNTAPNAAKNRVSRFHIDASNPNVVDPNTPELVLIDNIASDTGYHNGGSMHFGSDGLLYVCTGEAGYPSASQASPYAQDLSSLNGKVLRINPNAYPNLVPAGNPFVNTPGARPEIWAYGLRNPFTSAVLRGAGPAADKLFVNDVGSGNFEEINSISAGGNYGWPGAEGPSTNPAYTNPLYAYPHTDSLNGRNAAITGGVFYTGTQFPAPYRGKYFFSDYINKFVRVLDPATGQATSFATDTNGMLDLDVGPDGSLYGLAPYGNVIVKISYVGSANRPPVASASATPTSGLTPLTVNFNAAGSSDPDQDPLTYTWNFGDGSAPLQAGPTTSHVYTQSGKFTASLTVSDGRGGSATSAAMTIQPGNRAPVGTITSPAAGSAYDAGQTITYAGAASDPEDGTLPPSAFSWSVVLHHGNHTHPFLGNINGVTGGSFVIPPDGETDPDQFYRIHLFVTDSKGLQSETTRDVVPHNSQFTLASNVAGLTLNLEGQPHTSPLTIAGVVGATRQLGAPLFQVLNGRPYQFVSWSDGGAAVHTISTPSSATVYTATYAQITSGLLATYFDNKDFTGPSVQRVDSTVNFNFGTGSPDPSIAADTFSARWTGKVTPQFGQTYTFYTTSDDGIRLWVNGRQIIDNFTNHAPTENSGSIALAAGQAYDIKLEYYENAGGAVAKLLWSSPSTPKAVIPASRLSPVTSQNTLLGPSADAYVRDGSSANTNFGGTTDLVIKRDKLGYTREAYLKFDLTGVDAASVQTAKLRLFGGLAGTGSSNISTAVYSTASTTWTESGLTWNNRPPTGATALATTVITDGTARWYEWDLAAFLKSELQAGRRTISLVLRNLTTSVPTTSFSSNQAGANRPQLLING